MNEKELINEILRVAGQMGLLHHPPYAITSIEKLARVARNKGRQEVLDILRDEVSSDKAQSAMNNSVTSLLYRNVAKKLEMYLGPNELLEGKLEELPEAAWRELETEGSIFPPWLDDASPNTGKHEEEQAGDFRIVDTREAKPPKLDKILQVFLESFLKESWSKEFEVNILNWNKIELMVHGKKYIVYEWKHNPEDIGERDDTSKCLFLECAQQGKILRHIWLCDFGFADALRHFLGRVHHLLEEKEKSEDWENVD